MTLFPSPSSPRGASWGPDDTIIFANNSPGLFRGPAAGGDTEVLTTPDVEQGERHWWPEVLPGGQAVLFTIVKGPWAENQEIAVLDLETGEQTVLVPAGSNPHYAHTGHIVYGVDGTLRAVPFDLDRLEVTGAPVPVLEGVRTRDNGAVQFSLSAGGSLVYVAGDAQRGAGPVRTLVWVDRQGREESVAAPPRAYDWPQLSPDGQRIAVEVGPEIWLHDLARDTLTRFTFEGDTNAGPTWTPDGERIVFRSNTEDPAAGAKIFWQFADGSGGLERLTSGEQVGNHNPKSWSADGQLLAFHHNHATTQKDIWVLRRSDGEPEPFLRTPFSEGAPDFSPDGRWLAYVSDESGRPEIYVQPYPGPGGKWQISTDGGLEPRWSRDGRELFYRSGSRMMAVDIATEPAFSPGRPTTLFEGDYRASEFPLMGIAYDVSPDGQRFLMVKEGATGEAASPQIIVVQNWHEELKRLVPVD